MQHFLGYPLYGNYVENNSEKVAVPDCIQFRFKTARTADATSNFSESVLLKRGGMGGAVLSGTAGAESRNGDFGIYLHQSGSQSGSYPGAIDSHYNTYASMSFVISGSTSDGATSYNGGAAHCFVTDPIYLPFYNKEWWTVQIQRKTHLSASNENNNFNEYELRVGQNIYEGYDGNEIGWVGSSSLEMTGTLPSSSMNEAWNKFYMLDDTASLEQITQYVNSQVILPGNLFPNPLPTTTASVNKVGNGNEFPMYPAIEGFDLGDTMSGSFQEFRYYRRAISGSAFNDLIMNPESIQGHADSNTGAGSSYDLLSYRVPLGNELEFIEPNGSASQFDGTTGILPVPSLLQFVYGQLQPKASSPYGDFGGNSVGSVHPSAVNYVQTSSLFTGSFFNIHFPYLSASSQPIIQPYALNYRLNATASSAISSSYISPNNEINYMDQPSAGIRNRIKNKIAVIDGNEYGTTLSPFRTIQQEFEQSGSYTEDLNSLEVGFSFQNEVNDDIIATFGHGVVSDAIADPRFISESSDRYPELTRIADDYFKKYEGFTHNTPLYDNGLPTLIEQEYDYNRLIKFYETSLFRAIKAYVPARTSLSTGVIVKQHLLERNKTDAIVAFNINSAIAITPETGSDSWGYTNQTGFNSVISNKNLLISSSIGMYSLTGSAGGSINKFNIPTSSISDFTQSWDYTENFTGQILSNSTQDEFYNGEYSGSNISMIPNQYNPYRIFADGNNQTADTFPPSANPVVDIVNAQVNAQFGNRTANSFVASNTFYGSVGTKNITNAVQPTADNFPLQVGASYKMSFTVSGVTGNARVGCAIYVASYGSFDTLNKLENTLPSAPTIGINGDFEYVFTYYGAALPGGIDGLGTAPVYAGLVPFFLNFGAGQSAILSNLKLELQEIAPKHFFPRDGFTIVPSQSQLFQNSPYNPIINNVSSSRKNSFFFDQDFASPIPGQDLREGIPTDYQLVVSASQLGKQGFTTADDLLEYAPVPDSNYTARAMILPRYSGSRLYSADYNFYTGIPSQSKLPAGITGLANPPYLLTQNKVLFPNGETGSWQGDDSYGKTAVIDRNPIMIGHFKSSLESKEYYGTTTFNMDQLIQIPFEEILSEQSPIITSSLINGSNENLIPMSTTFMPGREATIIYNQTSKTFNNIGGTILNYTNLGIGAKEINAGAINFVAYQSNERALNNLSTIQYYTLPIWYSYKLGISASAVEYGNSNIENTPNSASMILTASYYDIDPYPLVPSRPAFPSMDPSVLSTPTIDIVSNLADPTIEYNFSESALYTKAPNPIYALTGSLKDFNNRDVGILHLRGPNTGYITAMVNQTIVAGFNDKYHPTGPSICMFNSWNHLISLGDINEKNTSPAGTNCPVLNSKGFYNPITAFSLKGNLPFPICSGTNPMSNVSGQGTANIIPPVLPSLSDEEIANNDNYFRWNISGSALREYRNEPNQRIKVDVGDEIRVSYGVIPNPLNPALVSKTHQDFTVLGYQQSPPSLFTSNVILRPTSAVMNNDLRIDIAVYKIYGYDYLNYSTYSEIVAPLSGEGYYNYEDTLHKYQASKHNGDTFYGVAVDYNGDYQYFSGSIVNVNERSITGSGPNRSGVVGLTMSMDMADAFVGNNAYNLTSFVLSTTYQAQLSPANAPLQSGNMQTTNSTPLFASASISPVVVDPNSTTIAFRNYPLDPGYLFDRVIVEPDPTKLAVPIPQGRIFSMTLRKREEADDRVVLNAVQPSGSAGALTLSGDGYLVPNDLTPIQQRNVQKIINKLKSENVFQPDSNDLQS